MKARLYALEQGGVRPPAPAPPASDYGGQPWQVPGWNPPAAPQGTPPQQPAPPANGNGHPPTPAPQAPVVPAPAPSNAQLEAARKFLRDEYGQEMLDANEGIVSAYAQQMAEMAVQTVAQRFGPQFDRFGQAINQQAQQFAAQENERFNQELASKGHQDWANVIETPEFKSWLQAHPAGPEWWGSIYPDANQWGGTVSLYGHVLDEFKRQHPVYQSQMMQDEEARRRQAAAAASARADPRAMSPDTPSDAPTFRRSEIPRRMMELASDPKALTEYNNAITRAMAENRVLDDVTHAGMGSAPSIP